MKKNYCLKHSLKTLQAPFFIMAETSEQLIGEAVLHFNESLDMIQEGKMEEALGPLKKAEKAAHEARDEAVLLHILELRGKILESLGRFEEALETYTFVLKTNEKLFDEDPENELCFDVLKANLNNIGNLGNIFRRKGNFQFSKQSYETGLEICHKRLESQPENEFCRTYAGNTLNNLGELLAEKGQPEKAKINYEKALEIYENLLKAYPGDLEHISDKVMALQNLGILFYETGQKEEAKKNLKKALEILDDLNKSDPENKKVEEELSFTRKKLETL